MAALNAAVLSALPSPLAPYFVTSKLTSGNWNGLIALTMSWASCHGRSLTATLWPAPAACGVIGAAAGAVVPARADFARIGAATAAPATAAPMPTTCRRDRLSAMFLRSSWLGQRIRRRESAGPTADG